MPLNPGTRVGSYEVLSILGAGGMGEVYRARDTKLNRDVALKILPDLFLADADRLARFQREAQVLASLNHPNIAQIYAVEDASTGSGQAALVMELVDGEDLSVIVARGPVAVREALGISRQVADALAAAHEAGIIHRDLKPANVKVRADGTVKVLDFGLAKAMEPAGASGSASAMNSPTLTARATEIGVILGTAAYMAPEQARGKVVDRRADLWAFGVVLYEILTGRRAFDGPEVSDVLAAVLKDTPAFDALPSDTPVSVRRLLRRTMEKDRAKRLDSMAAARLELDEADRPDSDVDRSASGATTSPAHRLVLPVLGAAAVSALAIGAVVWRLMQPPAPEVRRFAITAAADMSVQVETNHEDVAITPDGSRMVYFSRTGTDGQLIVRPLDRFEGTALTKLGLNARGAFVSANGQWVGFQAGAANGTVDNTLSKVPITGGAPVPICPIDANIRGASWAADDTIVFATISRSGLQRVAAAGGKPEVLTTPAAAEGELDHLWPSFLPDGLHVLFTIQRTGEASDIAVLSLDTRTWRVILKDGYAARYVSSGHLVYASNGALRAVRFDPKALAVRGDPIEVQAGVMAKSSLAANFAVSDTGTLVYLPGIGPSGAEELVWRAADGTETLIGLPPNNFGLLSLSPDGRFVATGIGPSATEQELYLIDLSRPVMSRLTPVGMHVTSVTWRPDSKTAAFRVAADAATKTEAGIFQIAVTGAAMPERLTTSPDNVRESPGAWSADGKQLLLTRAEGVGSADIYQLTPGGTPAIAPLLAGPLSESAPAVSPDGKWLAYVEAEVGKRRDVFLRPFPNVNDQRIPITSDSGSSNPAWSADGNTLFFRGAEGDVMSVAVGTGRVPSIGKPTRLLSFDSSNRRATAALPPVGQRVLTRRSAGVTVTTPNEYRVVLNWTEELKARVK